MEYDDIAKHIAAGFSEAIEKHTPSKNTGKKDALTDVAGSLATPANQPSSPSGTVIASDGRVVTLGQDNAKKPNNGYNQGK